MNHNHHHGCPFMEVQNNHHENLRPYSPHLLVSLGLGIIFAFFFLLLVSQTSTASIWSGEEQVTYAEYYAGMPSVGIDDDDNVYVVWEEGDGFFNESRDIHLMKMSSAGDVILNRTIASAYTLDASWPDIAVEADGTVHVVMQDTFFRKIYYMSLSSDGEILIPALPINQWSIGAYTPSIDVDNSGLVHIVWLDVKLISRDTDHEIYYTLLDPSLAVGRIGGISDEDIRLIDDTRISSHLMIIDLVTFYEFLTGFRVLEYPPFPNIAVDSEGTAHVVWTDGRDSNPEIYYSHLDPTLASWNGSSSDRSLISIVDNSRITYGASYSLQPMVAVGPDDMIHLAYTNNDTGSFEVYYGTITNGSFTSPPVQVSRDDQEPSGLSPIIVDSEGNIYISWRDMCCGHFEVFLSKIDPSGDVLWNNQRISHCDSTAGSPPVVVDSNLNPIIFWQDNRTTISQVYYNRTVMFPDLSIQVSDITSDAMNNIPSTIDIVIENTGNVDTAFEVAVTIDEDHQKEQEWTRAVFLGAEESKVISIECVLEAGEHEVEVILDPLNLVKESDENDNHAIAIIEVPHSPDLGLQSAELIYDDHTTQLIPDKDYSITVVDGQLMLNLTLYNEGGSHSGPMKILVEGFNEGGNLDPVEYSTITNMNASSYQSISFMLDQIPGIWDYSIQIDPDSEVDPLWKSQPTMNFTLAIVAPPDPSISNIELSGKKSDGETLEITVFMGNEGSSPSTGQLIIFIDDEIIDTKTVYLSSNGEAQQQFQWNAKEGTHTITAELVTALDSDSGNNSLEKSVTIGPPDRIEIDPIILSVSSVAILAGLLVIFTEAGRYNFLKFLVIPLYTRLKRGKILDHFLRGQVYGFIKANPGAHYNLIRRTLDINNGALAYHIAVLEREKFIRSRMDGTLKRFYPSDMNLPQGHELTEMERTIIDIIRSNPGFSQKEIALTIGSSPQVVNYHIKSLARTHVLKLTRVGKRTLCYMNEDFELDS
jgi:DNA-binding CsgD family transcriptional regulator